MDYAILCNPGHNRVYFETSLRLSVSEFAIAAQALSARCGDVRRQNLCGIDYLTFQTQDELSRADIMLLSSLSFTYALFQLESMHTCLKPVELQKENFVDESMSAILKYTGKTNELFTRMMINIALCSQGSREGIRLLDPIAGKGTTLYEGYAWGFDVYGIEIGESVVNESAHFTKKFLETARYKFDYAPMKISGPNKSFSALRHTFHAARTKEEFKGKRTKTMEFIAGNALYANKFYPKNFFDILVGDLPYGVQHGNVTREGQSSLTRNPAELLRACLPAWRDVLKPGGAAVLAWNSHVLPREQMERIFMENGFLVKKEAAYLQFEHRVDQSILRDIVAAQKEE
ncbi:MAG: DNA methylase [Firmicutes bacterium]|nr:DNA methylase [Bacillota bacterium]